MRDLVAAILGTIGVAFVTAGIVFAAIAISNDSGQTLRADRKAFFVECEKRFTNDQCEFLAHAQWRKW